MTVQTVFLSYASIDRHKANVVADELRSLKYSVWVDWDSDLAGYQDWRVPVEAAIRNADLVLYLESDAASTSPQCEYELAKAREALIPIVALRLGDSVVGDPEAHRIRCVASWSGERDDLRKGLEAVGLSMRE